MSNHPNYELIAKKAGVAKSTVSLALRNSPKLLEKTRLLDTVKVSHEDSTIQALDTKFHETLQRYRQVVSDRRAFLRKSPTIEYP